MRTNYVQVCKHFLEAVEKKQYGWFWVCPNGGKECHYRHALPPGYVLKSQMKALIEEESEKISIEEEIENQVSLKLMKDSCVIQSYEPRSCSAIFLLHKSFVLGFQRAKVTTTTPMTPELFMQWKKKKIEERDAGLAAEKAERAKMDRMRYHFLAFRFILKSLFTDQV